MFSQPSAAITMGRLRGASVLGQPLDLAIPLQLGNGEDVAGLCVAADAYFGDLQVDSSQVSTHLGLFNGEAAIRLYVRRPVDEPVVTVYVKVGCQQQSTRKYVLLSEFASETQRKPSTFDVSEVPRAVGRTLGNASDEGGVANGPTQSRILSSRPEKTKEKRIAAEPSRSAGGSDSRADGAISRGTASVLRKTKPSVGGARLKLLPLDLTQAWEPSLRLSDQLTLPPENVDERKRAEAMELWRVLNASPEEILQESAKRIALEAELHHLVSASRSNQAAIAELNVQLKAAQEQRLFNPLVFVLLALLIGCGVLGGFVFLSRRRGGNNTPWWESAENTVDTAHPAHVDYPVREAGVNPAPVAESRIELAANANVDIPLTDSVFPVEAAKAEATRPTVASGGADSVVDFAHSAAGALRAINTQEMVDVRQQADFFLALGQHDDAVSVLYGALGQATKSNPYIYLDLVALLHKLSRKDEYEKVRHAFNTLYTGIVPSYGAYAEPGPDLLDYPDLLMPLVQVWPTYAALDYVEQCLVREPADPANSGLGMEVFKDFLLLHGILRSLHASSESVSTLKTPIPKRVLPRGSGAKAIDAFQLTSDHRLDLDLSEGA